MHNVWTIWGNHLQEGLGEQAVGLSSTKPSWKLAEKAGLKCPQPWLSAGLTASKLPSNITKLTWGDTTVPLPRLHPAWLAGIKILPSPPGTEGECEAAIKYHHVQSAVSYGHAAEQLSPATSQSCSFHEPMDCRTAPTPQDLASSCFHQSVFSPSSSEIRQL